MTSGQCQQPVVVMKKQDGLREDCELFVGVCGISAERFIRKLKNVAFSIVCNSTPPFCGNNEGLSSRDVSMHLGVNKSNVQSWRRYRDTGTADDLPHSGHPKATTAADDRYLGISARRNLERNTAMLNNDFCAATEHQTNTEVIIVKEELNLEFEELEFEELECEDYKPEDCDCDDGSVGGFDSLYFADEVPTVDETSVSKHDKKVQIQYLRRHFVEAVHLLPVREIPVALGQPEGARQAAQWGGGLAAARREQWRGDPHTACCAGQRKLRP